MRWQISDGADPVARKLADRHYNRQSVGHPKFTPPGRNIVLRTATGDAVWSTAAPIAAYVRHEWAGAWVNTLFRNEQPENLSSELITEAVAASLWLLGDPPELGLITFVDPACVRSENPGYCYRMAGFVCVGKTKVNERLAFQMLPEAMPTPEQPLHVAERLQVMA